MSENLADLVADEQILTDLFASKLLYALTANLDISGTSSLTDRQKLALELTLQIVKLQKRTFEEYQKDIPLNFEINPTLRSTIQIY